MSTPICSQGQAQVRSLPASINSALELLRSVPSGQALLEKARKTWKITDESSLLRVFKLGSTSRTDAVLTRHFNSTTGKERRERKITISIRRNQSVEDMVLDMAHEITHATAEPAWDPYDPDLTLGKYISAALEAEGGEVDAVVEECRVAADLVQARSLQIPRCTRYFSPQKSVDRELVRMDFYRVGKWKTEVLRRLEVERDLFPLLSGDKPQLYSSTGQAPYPAALIGEFDDLNRIACENVRKRVERTPASSGASPGSRAASRELLARRCSGLP
jgi:hypothetical protein